MMSGQNRFWRLAVGALVAAVLLPGKGAWAAEYNIGVRNREVNHYWGARIETAYQTGYKYSFGEDTTLRLDDVAVLMGSTGTGNGIWIDAAGRQFDIRAEQAPSLSNKGLAGIKSMRDGTIDITVRQLIIKVVERDNDLAYGIQSNAANGDISVHGNTEIDVTGRPAVAVNADQGSIFLEGLKIDVRSNDDYAIPDVWAMKSQHGRIAVNVRDDVPGTSDVIIKGNLNVGNTDAESAVSKGRIQIAMTTPDSSFTGLSMIPDGQGSLKAGRFDLWLQNGAVWNNEIYGRTEMPVAFTGSRVTHLTGGAVGKEGVIFQKDAKPVTIDSYSGSSMVLYGHDAAAPASIIGGDIVVKSAAAGSRMTLRTDNTGIDTQNATLVQDVLGALSGKLIYQNAATESNLAARTEIAEGLTASSAWLARGDVAFLDTGKGALKVSSVELAPPPTPPTPPTPVADDDSGSGAAELLPLPLPAPEKPAVNPAPAATKTPVNAAKGATTPAAPAKKPAAVNDAKATTSAANAAADKTQNASAAAAPASTVIQTGPYETAIMRGVRSAMTAPAMAWRAEANDLMKRLGDLRLSPGELGAWARFYRSRTSSHAAGADFRLDSHAIQAGYDWQAGSHWRLGLAATYLEGRSSVAGGRGDNYGANLGFYGSWLGDHGHYLDLIAKAGRLTNHFQLAAGGYRATADYDTWALSASAEYGRRIPMGGGFFLEPQAELTYSHLLAADYTVPAVYLAGESPASMAVSQSPFNSLVGRLGLGAGYRDEGASCFARVSLCREFCGRLRGVYRAESVKTTRADYRDTWWNLEIGGTVKLGDRCALYGTFEKTFAGLVTTDWRVDAGLRWTF
ncbi:MAG: autotransporter outer membrane beta-barrel domain-containing protein [Schwartzia sp.]|nr:autotransporter outer membrane beta-barrel domain-containing protein [Schwartzia sp. (in: firmicutes)]